MAKTASEDIGLTFMFLLIAAVALVTFYYVGGPSAYGFWVRHHPTTYLECVSATRNTTLITNNEPCHWHGKTFAPDLSHWQ